MSIRSYLFPLMLAVCLAACATTENKSGRVVERLPAEATQSVTPALPKLSLQDISRLAREGLAAESIIGRLKESHTRLRLSATDVLNLKAQGVPLAVMDYLLDSDRQAALDECSERINRLSKDQSVALQQSEMRCMQRCNLSCPTWPAPYPWRRWP